jgi:hypothetical protein
MHLHTQTQTVIGQVSGCIAGATLVPAKVTSTSEFKAQQTNQLVKAIGSFADRVDMANRRTCRPEAVYCTVSCCTSSSLSFCHCSRSCSCTCFDRSMACRCCFSSAARCSCQDCCASCTACCPSWRAAARAWMCSSCSLWSTAGWPVAASCNSLRKDTVWQRQGTQNLGLGNGATVIVCRENTKPPPELSGTGGRSCLASCT